MIFPSNNTHSSTIRASSHDNLGGKSTRKLVIIFFNSPYQPREFFSVHTRHTTSSTFIRAVTRRVHRFLILARSRDDSRLTGWQNTQNIYQLRARAERKLRKWKTQHTEKCMGCDDDQVCCAVCSGDSRLSRADDDVVVGARERKTCWNFLNREWCCLVFMFEKKFMLHCCHVIHVSFSFLLSFSRRSRSNNLLRLWFSR